MKFNTVFSRYLTVFFATFSGFATNATIAVAEDVDFSGELVATVDPQTYEFVKATITGDAAEALFNVTAALARLENFDVSTRIVRGRNISCFEHFSTSEIELPITYSCAIVVGQGGKIERPAQEVR